MYTTREIVQQFLNEVRSGQAPDRVHDLMAPRVLAHQVVSEAPNTVERSPANYAEHIRAFLSVCGAFRFEVTELVVKEDRAYARWRQVGQHEGEVDGFAATGKPVVEVASAVYRVEDGRIVEYWIQVDREGMRRQLESNMASPVGIQMLSRI
ncbi:ester cyclase [Deinococcus hopiensis]|uniref:Predicted ester cyclase n=1 Tax=Deinococcus hopiensis KR-140 TaxID=695939 RepID=A0A1W1URK5_9DEIO|nr:ester cyclase [Deinococcus hopiensis]SMB83441.1 Predicted ester cyclase [Deinococcus hopiensis KR-140]